MIKKRKIITPKDDDCFKHIFGKVGNEDITKEFCIIGVEYILVSLKKGIDINYYKKLF